MLPVLVTLDTEETLLRDCRDWDWDWDSVEDRLVMEVARDLPEEFDVKDPPCPCCRPFMEF